MKDNSRYIFSIIMAAITILSLLTDNYAVLTISLSILLLVMILNKMGKGIVLRESTAILYVITCLLMPLVGYNFYSSTNHLSRIWYKFMLVPEDIYFGFSLPAISAFCLAITWPLSLKEGVDEGDSLKKYFAKIKLTLSTKKNYAIPIMIIGIVAGRVAIYLPGGLQFFANLFYFASFAGLLYIYFTKDFKHKKLLMFGFLGFILINALGSGMFTIVAYMGATIYSFFLIGSAPSFFKKLIIMVVAIIFIIVLQNTKLAYRKFIWKSNYQGSQIALFADLFFQSLSKGDGLITNTAFFTIYARTNQGFNISLVMRRIPLQQEHDNGINLLKAFASSVVPRFLWPDKPEAGGKFNMKYYANVTLRGWSTNIGPLGEAYGAFGGKVGILYMFLLGVFIRWAYKKVFTLSNSIPLLICWIPVLFYQITYSGEADTLQIMNSLLKSALFMYIIYRVVPGWFGVSKEDDQETQVNEVINESPSYSSI